MLTKNSGEWLPEVLGPLVKNKEAYDLKLVCVDGYSKDDSLDLIQEAFPDAVIDLLKSRSLATNRNRALELAYKNYSDAEFMCWIDSDVVVPDNYFVRCLKMFEDPKVGIVGLRFELERDPAKGFVAKFYRDRTDIIRSGVFETDYTTTANSMFRGSLGKNIMIDDERFERAGEDVDFNLQIRKQGYKALVDANFEPSWHIRKASVMEELHRVKDHGLARGSLVFKYSELMGKGRQIKTFIMALLVAGGIISYFLIPFIGLWGMIPLGLVYLRHWFKCRDRSRLDYAFFGALLSTIYFLRFWQGAIQWWLHKA